MPRCRVIIVVEGAAEPTINSATITTRELPIRSAEAYCNLIADYARRLARQTTVPKTPGAPWWEKLTGTRRGL